MHLRVVAVLVGLSLMVVSQLGIPSAAAMEPLLLSLSEEPVTLCEGDALTGLPEPEAVTACSAADLSVACLSVKQPDEEDGSAASLAQELASSAPAAPIGVASLPAEVIPPPVVALVLRYQVEDNHDVRRFLDQFQTGYRRAVVERWLVRAGRYLPMVLDVFKQKGLPEELVFTAMIESGFDPLAASRAGAKTIRKTKS